MTKYEILTNILAGIISEAPEKYSKLYEKDTTKTEQYYNSLSRAFIHLFLKVRFDLTDFEEREHFITDGGNDGGIDGYYIDSEHKEIFLFQSKFRANENNFHDKEISMKELLSMDIERILSGETKDEKGIDYRGKIYQLQREISEIPDIPRYTYRVIIFANLKGVSDTELKRLTGGYKVEVIDYQKCYSDFVFPIISGTYYSKSDLMIQIDLSNKMASKISYTVDTSIGDCDITVLFVPTVEVGRFMSKYKNSILKFNPRSYLGFKAQDVNRQIADSVTQKKTNEFALFNNGITLLSEETFINEHVANKGVAKLIVKNPQIINGGQTSFTLSRLYEDNSDKNIFDKKEVLLKVITLPPDATDKEKLIEEISNATNHQTPVGPSDRLSNMDEQVYLQQCLYDRFGVLYERKRGEYSDGIAKGYIREDDIIDRSLFIKIYYTLQDKVSSSKAKKLFVTHKWTREAIDDDKRIMATIFGCKSYKKLFSLSKANNSDLDMLAKVKAMVLLFQPENISDFDDAISRYAPQVIFSWPSFLEQNSDKVYQKTTVIDMNKEVRVVYKRVRAKMRSWINSVEFEKSARSFFKL